MNQSSLQADSARPLWPDGFRGSCHADSGARAEPTVAVSLAVGGANYGSSQEQHQLALRLGSHLPTGSIGSWVCPAMPGVRWVDSLIAANCDEVVLTAQVGNSGIGLVLELAGFLTRVLERNKPSIRVRFVPHGKRARSPRGRR